MKTFELIRDFNENGVNIKKGDYTLPNLINIYGSEDRFNFCFKATSLKEVLKEKIETPENKLEIEKPEDNIKIETQEINVEIPEDKLEIEKPEDNIKIETQEINVEIPEDKLKIETKAKKIIKKR